MGNSSSGQHAYKNNPPQFNQYVQSLPREGRGRGSSTAAAQKYYNGGFKVLPERVPGQKLRLTDNGNLLQNGGTLSGRRLANEAPETDAEFAQLMKRRSDIVKGSPKESYDDSNLSHHKGDNSTMGKKYHSNPDLLNSHGIISGNPSGIQPSDQKKKKLQKKSKAPPPPQGYAEEDMMHPYSYEKAGHSPVKEKKRPFAHFLKPASKKSNEVRKPSPTHQDFGPAGHHPADGQPSGSPPSSSINAEITSAKLNSRDKSVTYVLERRDYHSSSSVLNTSKVQHQFPTENTAGDRRYVKSPDSTKLPQPHGSGYHAQLQGKLSDGGLQAQTVDRAEIRNKAFEIQKRVRSMDSLACSSDERDIYHQQQQPSSPLRNELQERFARQSREIKSLDNLQSVVHNGKGGPLGRQPSNSSSLLSDRNRERPPWDRAQQRHRHASDLPTDNGGPTRPISMPYPRESDGHPNRDFLDRSDSNNRKAYYYGGGQRNQATYSPNQRTKESFPGSLGRRENGDVKVHHQRTPSGTAMPTGQSRMPSEEQEAMHRDLGEHQDGSHRLSNLEINKNFNQSQYNRNLDQFSKDKLRPMNSKEIIINTVREGDHASPKMSKDYHDKDAVSEHLQEAFFAKTKETRAGVIEYNRKLASGHHVRESSQTKTNDGDLSSEDEMDINMQLRPMLPKRLQSMPRFSPQQVWRSFSLDDAGDVDKCSEHSSDGEEGDVFEDRIMRVARPVAPPRSNNEKSADSGISPGAGSPGPAPYDFDAVVIPEKCPPTTPPPPPPLLPSKNPNRLQSPVIYPPELISPFTSKDGAHVSDQNDSRGHGRVSHHYDPPSKSAEDKKPLWTPEEDLASDFDAGSGDHQAANIASWTSSNREMISTQPKLISRKDMFVSKKPSNSNLLMDKDNKLSDYSDAEGKANGKSGKKNKGTKNGDPNSPQKYNSVRKLKRSLSGVLQGHVRIKSGEDTHTNLDDNWSLSRSLPNSLHNGHEGERMEKKQPTPEERVTQVADNSMSQQRLPRSESGPIYVASKRSSEFVERQPFTDLEGRAFSRERARAAIGAGTCYNRNGHIVYLPKYEAMEIIEENMDPIGMERRAYSDLGMGTNTRNNNAHNFPFRKPKKFTYQSTVRQNERKQLEQKLSQEVAVKEKQRAREMDLVNKVEEEFQKKRDREKADIRQQLRILSLESCHSEDLSNGYYEGSRSLPREYPTCDDKEHGNNDVVDVRETSSMNRNEHGHLSLPPLIIPPEDYDLTIPKDSTKLKLGSLPGRNSKDFGQPTQVKAYGKNSQMEDSSQSSGFFSGIGKWMRRQQRLEKHGAHVPSRQEPEGAPSAFGPSSLPLHDGERLSSERLAKGLPSSIPSSPHHENRSNAIAGAKFSSGRTPDGQAYQPPMPAIGPQQRKSIYSHLTEVAEKEEHLRLKQQQGRNHGDKDARTSVWISSDKSYPKSPPSKAFDGHNVLNDRTQSDFYEIPYDSLSHPGNRVDINYGQKSRYDKPQSKSNDDMLDNYNRARHGARHNALQREWNAGQRHSIAVDPSRDQWATGIIPPPRGFDEGRRQSRDSDFTSSNSYSTPNNEHGELGWIRGVGHQDSYRESLEDDEYRRRSKDPTLLTSHHRSLSFNHINSEEGSSNGRKPENASPRPAVSPVQPFHPNKAYRPVAFQTGNHGFSK